MLAMDLHVHESCMRVAVRVLHSCAFILLFFFKLDLLCYLVTRAEAVASTSNTVEYQTIISCTTKLAAAVCNDLVRLSGCLLEKGFISQENASGLRNRNIEEADQAAHLVDLVQQKIKLESQNYMSSSLAS